MMQSGDRTLAYLAAVFVVLFVLAVGFALGFFVGTYNQETVLLNEIYIRDFNLTDRMCLYDKETREVATYKHGYDV